MRPRTAVVLAILGAIVLAAGWWFGPGTLPGERTSVYAGKLMFPGLTPKLQDAARVEIVHQGKTLSISRHGDRWGLDNRGGYQIEAGKLRGMLTALTELRLVAPRTANPADYSRLGVGDPNAKNTESDLLRVIDAKGKTIAALIVGHRRVLTQGNVPDQVFVRRPGEAQTWLAEGNLSVDADPQVWLDLNIMNIDHSRIAGITVTRGGATLVFAAKDGKLALTAPAEHGKLDPYKLDDLDRGLELLSFEDVHPGPAPDGPQVGKAVFTTTDGLAVTVRLFHDGKALLARFAVTGTGKAEAEAVKLDARVKGWNYEIGSWKEASLAPTLNGLLASHPAKAPAVPAAAGDAARQ